MSGPHKWGGRRLRRRARERRYTNRLRRAMRLEKKQYSWWGSTWRRHLFLRHFAQHEGYEGPTAWLLRREAAGAQAVADFFQLPPGYVRASEPLEPPEQRPILNDKGVPIRITKQFIVMDDPLDEAAVAKWTAMSPDERRQFIDDLLRRVGIRVTGGGR